MASYDDIATVSGSVVAFSNGADEVYCKSVKASVAPTMAGVSSVEVVNSGKNLANIGAVESCTNTSGAGSSITQNNDGSITIVTTTQQNVKCLQKFRDIFPNVKVGQTCILSATTTGTQKQIYLHGVSTVWTFGQSKTITEGMLNSDVSFYASGTNTTAIVSNFQLEYGSTATAYEPYTAPTTYTASLGRTIYGGEVDIVNGEGTDGYIKYVIDGVNNYAVNISGTNFNIMPYGLNIDGTISKWLCDTITASGTNFGYNSSQGFIFIRQAGWSSISGVTDVATFNAYCQEHPITMILPLVTPTDFTFTGQDIPTRLGNNTMYADSGDIEVTYFKDGYGYTSVTVNQKDGNDQLILSATRKFHRVVYEAEVDVINGTGTVYIGESGAEYDPPETITFEPVEVNTVQGTNILYANEGDSVITYRKETE